MKIYGDVQGVGFRYRTEHAANMLRLTGWVRNDWDGSVEMEVQGDAQSIDQLLVLVGKGTYINIDRIDSKVLPIVLKGLEEIGEDYKIMILPDHPTPLSTKTHAGDPVPYMIYQKSKLSKMRKKIS